MPKETGDSSVSWSATYGSVGFHSSSVLTDSTKKQGDNGNRAKQPMPWKQWLLSPAALRAGNLALMCLAMFGYGMGISLFAPFFPTEAEKRGVSPTVVGLIFSSYTFVLFIGTPLTGKLVKHLGISYMIGAGMFLAGSSTVLFGFLDQAPPGGSYVALCFAVRIIQGCGASMYMTASYSVSAALYAQQIAFAYSLLETADNVGRVFGPSAGGGLYNLGGFPLPFFVVGALLLLFGVASLVFLQVTASSVAVFETAGASDGNDKDDDSEPPSWFHYYRVSIHAWILSLSQALAGFLFTFPEPTLSLYFATLGLTDPALVGLVFLAGSLFYSVVCVITGKAADYLPKYVYWMMAGGAAFAAVGMIIIGPTPPLQGIMPPSIPLTIAGDICIYIGVAILLSSVPQALSASIRAAGYKDGIETSSLIATIYNGTWFAGGCFGPMVSGALMDTLGFPWAATVMAGFAVFLFIILITGDVLNRFITSNRIDMSKDGEQYNYQTMLESSKTISFPRSR